MKNWEQYKRTVAGIEFRPVSMGTLTLLFEVKSPFVYGGIIEPLDYCIFAWLHAAPLQEVITSVKAGEYIKDAVIWGSECPTAIYASYTLPTVKALAKDLEKIFIDKDTGFIPFPLPSPCRRSWWKRAFHFMKRLLKIG